MGGAYENQPIISRRVGLIWMGHAGSATSLSCDRFGYGLGPKNKCACRRINCRRSAGQNEGPRVGNPLDVAPTRCATICFCSGPQRKHGRRPQFRLRVDLRSRPQDETRCGRTSKRNSKRRFGRTTCFFRRAIDTDGICKSGNCPFGIAGNIGLEARKRVTGT